MRVVFSFFLRLFLCFLAAKFILVIFGSSSRGYLLGLTAIFLANVYLFAILGLRERTRAASGRMDLSPGSPDQSRQEARDS